MAGRILHVDGNGDFTIGSGGSTHKKNHVGRRADMVFLMGAMEGVQGKPAANAAGVLWRAPPQAVRISLLAVSVEFATKYNGGN